MNSMSHSGKNLKTGWTFDSETSFLMTDLTGDCWCPANSCGQDPWAMAQGCNDPCKPKYQTVCSMLVQTVGTKCLLTRIGVSVECYLRSISRSFQMISQEVKFIIPTLLNTWIPDRHWIPRVREFGGGVKFQNSEKHRCGEKHRW